MVAFLLSLLMFFTPVGTAGAQPAPPPVQVSAPFAWFNGTWLTDALEMTCKATAAGTTCREEGRTDMMKGAEATLTITPADNAPGSQLKVALATVPPSIFAEVAREAKSVTYQMQTKVGIARLRFTRDGDTLRVERGNDKSWSAIMTYRKV